MCFLKGKGWSCEENHAICNDKKEDKKKNMTVGGKDEEDSYMVRLGRC